LPVLAFQLPPDSHCATASQLTPLWALAEPDPRINPNSAIAPEIATKVAILRSVLTVFPSPTQGPHVLRL